jgi:hypothetical protein
MNTLLDIFGSVVIAGMLFMMIVKLNLFSNQTSYTSDNELKLIQNTKTLAEIIDYDFRKIGYKYDGVAIEIADSNKIKFYADMQSPEDVSGGHGTMDEVFYSVGDSTEAVGTSNQRDRILKRIISVKGNLTPYETMEGPSLGLVRIKFTYLDAYQTPMSYINSNTYPDSIRYIKTEMWVQSTESVTDAFTDSSRYSITYWEFTINPRNL